MGRDKALLRFGDETQLQRVVRVVSQAVDEVVVVARGRQELPELPADVRVVHDDVLDQGPVGGLVPGLRACTAPVAFVTSCDVPFLNPAVPDLLFQALSRGPEAFDVAVPRALDRLQPLCAVYRTRLWAEVAALLAAGRLRPVFLFERVATLEVEEAELRRVDPELASLWNCNTPEDYDAALATLLGGAADRPGDRGAGP
jgi:molybdenum cofactor guanylyltransferase